MTLNSFVAYVKQFWKNKPDASTPLSAERLTHMEEGIKGNSNAIETIAAAVVNQIVNDPDKIASMAALYSVNQKIGDVSKLPDSAVDVVTAIAKQNSNLIMGVKEALGSVSINAKSILSVTHTFTVPDGYQKIPIMAYVANTGWTGVICQGISVNISTGTITFTFFKSLENVVTASPQSVAMFLKN